MRNTSTNPTQCQFQCCCWTTIFITTTTLCIIKTAVPIITAILVIRTIVLHYNYNYVLYLLPCVLILPLYESLLLVLRVTTRRDEMYFINPRLDPPPLQVQIEVSADCLPSTQSIDNQWTHKPLVSACMDSVLLCYVIMYCVLRLCDVFKCSPRCLRKCKTINIHLSIAGGQKVQDSIRY